MSHSQVIPDSARRLQWQVWLLMSNAVEQDETQDPSQAGT